MLESETYDSEIRNEFSTADSKRVIDSFVSFCSDVGIGGLINFTGGDPLLRVDIYELIAYARSFGIKVGMFGNPFQVNDDVAERLKKIWC
jgi:MoaA/NifB/PqqE/SkfB family radical SAM enzyme